MPRYIVTLTEDEVQNLKTLIQKGGKRYRIKHVQILLKLDKKAENKGWTYERIMDAHNTSRSTIAEVAKRFVKDGMESALGRYMRRWMRAPPGMLWKRLQNIGTRNIPKFPAIGGITGPK